jgi:hypothetical protein
MSIFTSFKSPQEKRDVRSRDIKKRNNILKHVRIGKATFGAESEKHFNEANRLIKKYKFGK